MVTQLKSLWPIYPKAIDMNISKLNGINNNTPLNKI
ncbi:hypothetical protein SAMN04488553_0982 [Gramella sp. MAR_2010_147]|nr:hypothetical protein SAMN04488553_0982 [Gramella sp. MAR_2010_147]